MTKDDRKQKKEQAARRRATRSAQRKERSRLRREKRRRIPRRYKIRSAVYHVLSVFVLLALALFGVFRSSDIFLRTWEAVRDFAITIASCFAPKIAPTVNRLPEGLTEAFPRVFSELVEILKNAGARLFTWENLVGYLDVVAQILLALLVFATIFGLTVVLPYGLFLYLSSTDENHRTGAKTKPLRIYLAFVEKVYRPVRRFIRGFFRFFRTHRRYFIPCVVLLAFFLNAHTVLLEFFAWYFTFDYSGMTLGIQILKLIFDLSLTLRFLPLWIWIFVALWIVDKIRKEIGYRLLERHEEKFRDLIMDLRIVTMVCAPMREGKTTFVTCMLMSLEKIFRAQAKTDMYELRMKFPDFPWACLEKCIGRAMASHEIYSLHTARKWIAGIYDDHMRLRGDLAATRKRRKELQKKYKLRFPNILFGYDTNRYPTKYDCGLGEESLADTLTFYVQLFFIYDVPSSLIISNYSVRMDKDRSTRGNFPQWKDDFYRTHSAGSCFSHILDQDALRLGKVRDPNGTFRNAIEFGTIGMTEIGKERGNQNDLKYLSMKDDNVNQVNDLFNPNLKLIGHSATVYYFPYIRFVCDEQRPDNWGADGRDLCHIVTLAEKSAEKILLPFSSIDEALFRISDKLYGTLEDVYREYRGDTTLSLYLLQQIHKKIFDHFMRIKSTYGGYRVDARIEVGTRDEKIRKERIFIANVKAHSQRFATDAYAMYYDAKAARSGTGINDMPTYAGLHQTLRENDMQHSHFFTKIDRAFLDPTNGSAPEEAHHEPNDPKPLEKP